MWKQAVVVVLVAACGTKERAAKESGGSAITGTVDMIADGERMEVTLTTEPGTDVYFSTERGGTTPMAAKADAQGHAKTRIEGALGPNKLTVLLTRERRKGEVAVPFAIEKAVPIEFTDPTPANAKAYRAINCSGTLMDLRRQQASLCGSYINLAADGTIGLATTSPSVKKLVIAGQTFTPENGTLTARVALAPLVAELDSVTVTNDYPLALPASLELANGTRDGTLSIGVGAVETFLAKITTGPVFPGTPRAAKPKSLVLIGDMTQTAGDFVKLKDLDLIGIVSSTTRSASACQYVATDGTGAKRSIARNMRDYYATIYERNTGKRLATKTWRAETPACDEWIQMNAPDSYASADTSLIFNWAETFVKD